MQKKSFNLDKNFYAPSVLTEAIVAFSEFTIELTEEGVLITDENPESIFDEFSNYAILLTNENTD